MTSTSRAGIIDVLSTGFTVVHRRPWLIAVPALLDLGFWQGPRVSLAPLAERLLAAYEGFLQRNPGMAGLGTDGPEKALEQARDLAESMAQGNLLHLLAWQLPSLAGRLGAALGEGVLPRWQISSVPEAILTLLGFLLIGLMGTALYLVAVAMGVRGAGGSVPGYGAAVRLGWLRLVGFFSLVALAAVPGTFLALLVLGIAALFSPAVVSLLSPLLLSLVLLAALYLAFVDEAIFAGSFGPWGALRQSVAVVARFFWSALGFLLLSNIMAAGLTVVWSRLFMVHPAAGVVAILGHAYIATGLAAAAMVFYLNRAALVAETQQRSVPA